MEPCYLFFFFSNLFRQLKQMQFCKFAIPPFTEKKNHRNPRFPTKVNNLSNFSIFFFFSLNSVKTTLHSPIMQPVRSLLFSNYTEVCVVILRHFFPVWLNSRLHGWPTAKCSFLRSLIIKIRRRLLPSYRGKQGKSYRLTETPGVIFFTYPMSIFTCDLKALKLKDFIIKELSKIALK